mmetsp:Transcript_51572/g.76443  ORF Transcript_51572/g.76443 Transcript_51572/m.76443 type:complete len:160 (+) Transcript_51572:3-482(+)
MRSSDTFTPLSCNREDKFGEERCPIFTVYAMNQELGEVEHYPVWPDLDELPDAWIPDEYNLYKGYFTITEKMANFPIVSIYVNKARKNTDIIMDDLVVKRVSCDNIVTNGNFEDEGALNDWQAIGIGSTVNLTSSGAPNLVTNDSSDHALTMTGRKQWN